MERHKLVDTLYEAYKMDWMISLLRLLIRSKPVKRQDWASLW